LNDVIKTLYVHGYNKAYVALSLRTFNIFHQIDFRMHHCSEDYLCACKVLCLIMEKIKPAHRAAAGVVTG
jgi:hypothetical protein